MNQDTRGRRRFPLDLCGPYVCDETDSKVRCYLQIAGSRVAIDVPADLLDKRRLDGQRGITLHLPGERMTVEAAPLLTEKEQRTANSWSLAMEDFDRF